MIPLTDQPDSSLDTTRARFAACPHCGARTLVCPGEEPSPCVGCLFGLALDEPERATAVESGFSEDSSPSCGTLGDYELLGEIGRGGMGVIYKARRVGGSETVAVKALLTTLEDAAEARARFEREVRAVASLHHPFVMPIHEVCLDGEIPYFSMDFASGGSLAELLPKYRGRWRQAARLVMQIAQAVHYAHRQGLIHRDLKPGNILFTEDHQPLVSDFGLAKWLDEKGVDLTRSLVMFGTPNYVSPEQAAGKNRQLTPATDIYSLGAVLFELLTNRPPFVGDSPLDVLQQTLAGNPQRLRLLNPAIPKDLETVCMRCLAKEPADRYASAKDFADDLGRWLNGQKVLARPRGLSGQFAAGFKDIPRPVGVILTLALVILAVVGFGILTRRGPAKSDRMPLVPTSLVIRTEDLSQGAVLGAFSERLNASVAHSLQEPGRFHMVWSGESTSGLPNDNRLIGPQEIGRKLASNFVLQEGVRVADSHTRVASRLVQSSDGKTVWARVDILSFPPSDGELTALAATIRDAVSGRLDADKSSNAERNETSASEIEAARFCARAKELYQNRTLADTDNAIALYKRALEIKPDYVDALAGLAVACRSKYSLWQADEQNLELAIQSARRALEIDPFTPDTHRALADCLFARARYQEAAEEYLQLLELNPQSAAGNAYLGMCWREMGCPRKALQWTMRASRFDPVHGVYNGILGDTYMLTGEDQKAVLAFQRMLEIDPGKPDPDCSLAVLYLWQSQFEKARRMSGDLIARFPDFRLDRQLAGEVAFFSGDDEDSARLFKALSAENDYVRNWGFFGAINPCSALAYLSMKHGDHEGARQYLDAAIRLDELLLAKFPNNPRLLHDLAATSALQGDQAHTLELLSSAIAAGWVEGRSTVLDPRFECLRGNPRFQSLMDQVSRQCHAD